MLNDMKLDLMQIMKSANFSDKLDRETLDELGMKVVEAFIIDRASRAEWERRNDFAMKLAMQVTEKKNHPWPDASNVKFPLLTIAAMQYHSRVYPALVNGPRPVACRIMAPMPTYPAMPPQPNPQDQQAMQQFQQTISQVKQRAFQDKQVYQKAKDKAQRISEHMSYQILEEDEQWEEEMDKLLLIQSIAGCAFKKIYYDSVAETNRSECVSPKELVVSYYTKNLETAPRVTHIILLSRNTVRERQRRGIWNEDVDGTPEHPTIQISQELNAESDKMRGQQQPPNDPQADIEFLEQHLWLDLDGDGYAEPYIVTVRFDTRQVMRIVARFVLTNIHYHPVQKTKIIRIDPISVFTKYPFIPSPDGGFYDIGFGALLGPINHSIDTALNQLIDAGSLANAGGGFLGRGFKGKKGELRFKLGEWKTTDSSGDDLQKSIYPLPVREPSSVLFNLLTLLIQYGQRVAGATDSTLGENPGQNTPAETARNTLEQGMKVFNGLYKRTHRSFTQELRKLYRLNQIFIGGEAFYFVPSKEGSFRIFGADYRDDSTVIRAAATPFYMSDSQRLNQATAVRQAAYTGMGFNLYIADKSYLEALKVDNVDELLPDPMGPNAVPPRPNPRLQIEQLKAQAKQLDGQVKLKLKALELSSVAQKVAAEIDLLRAQSVKTLAEAKGVDVGHQIALIEAQIGAKKAHQEGILATIKMLHEVSMDNIEANQHERTINSGLSSGMAGPSGDQGTSEVPSI